MEHNTKSIRFSSFWRASRPVGGVWHKWVPNKTIIVTRIFVDNIRMLSVVSYLQIIDRMIFFRMGSYHEKESSIFNIVWPLFYYDTTVVRKSLVGNSIIWRNHWEMTLEYGCTHRLVSATLKEEIPSFSPKIGYRFFVTTISSFRRYAYHEDWAHIYFWSGARTNRGTISFFLLIHSVLDWCEHILAHVFHYRQYLLREFWGVWGSYVRYPLKCGTISFGH